MPAPAGISKVAVCDLRAAARAYDSRWITCPTADKFDRIFQLHAILSARRTPVPLETLLARLECSRATLYRAVTALKDQLNAPIVYDADAGGFLYQRSAQADTGTPRPMVQRRRDLTPVLVPSGLRVCG